MSYISDSLKILVLVGSTVLLLACGKSSHGNKTQSSKAVQHYVETLEAKPMLVRVQDDEGSKLVSMKLTYSGKKGLENSMHGQDDAVQNLVISIVASYKYKDLSSAKGKKKFENKLLSSLNEFVAENKFTNVNLIELKEI